MYIRYILVLIFSIFMFSCTKTPETLSILNVNGLKVQAETVKDTKGDFIMPRNVSIRINPHNALYGIRAKN